LSSIPKLPSQARAFFCGLDLLNRFPYGTRFLLAEFSWKVLFAPIDGISSVSPGRPCGGSWSMQRDQKIEKNAEKNDQANAFLC